MRNRSEWHWWPLGVGLAPLGLGLVAALLWQNGLFPNPVLTLRFRVDVGTLLLIGGILLTLLAMPAAVETDT